MVPAMRTLACKPASSKKKTSPGASCVPKATGGGPIATEVFFLFFCCLLCDPQAWAYPKRLTKAAKIILKKPSYEAGESSER